MREGCGRHPHIRSHSSILHLYSYMRLVCCREGVGGDKSFLTKTCLRERLLPIPILMYICMYIVHRYYDDAYVCV